MNHPSVFETETESPSEDCPDVGIYPNVSFTEYCEWDAINHSKLQRIDKSPLHCREMPSFEKAMAIRLGQLVHCGHLEPSSVDARYAVMPQYELSSENVTDAGKPSTSVATKFAKEKRAEFTASMIQQRKTIVSQAEFDQYNACLDALLVNRQAMEIINDAETRTELSIVWHDKHTGLRCKARLDIAHPRMIGDLKTSRDDGPSPLPISFEYSLWQYNYYTQAAFYQSGWEAITGERLPFWFVVVSTTPPIQSIAAPVGAMSLELGRTKNQERMSKFAECRQSGMWPGYSSPELFELPEKYFPEIEVR